MELTNEFFDLKFVSPISFPPLMYSHLICFAGQVTIQRTLFPFRKGIEKLHQASSVPATMEVMCSGGSWRFLEDDHGAPLRDGFKCFSFLFGNPVFQNQLELSPLRVFDSSIAYSDSNSDSDSNGSPPRRPHIYSEIMTGNWAWEVQVMFSRVGNYLIFF